MGQTAMQKMIKKLEEKRDMWKADGKLSDRQIRGTYVVAILVAKELLEMEKEQIENAFEAGFITQQWDKTKENKAEQYFKEKFNK